MLLYVGDADNHIHFDGYQVSNQCMALVADDCLIPTRDAPELGYVKESTNEQYVPDVFYKVRSPVETTSLCLLGLPISELGQPISHFSVS